MNDEGTLVTAIEKPIEIRCYPPTVAQTTQDSDDDSTQTTEQLLDQIQTVPRCKLCGMEGHFSLQCPKRKEMNTAPVRVNEAPTEITILVTDISDMTTEAEFGHLLSETRNAVNKKLQQQNNRYTAPSQMKHALPKDMNGNIRGIAYINIGMAYTNDAPAFAEALVESLDGAKLGMVLIRASIQADRAKKRGPNRYDDEDKWGGHAGRGTR
jgi:phage FluMu protein Com